MVTDPLTDRRLVLAGDGHQGQRSDQPPVGRDPLRHPGLPAPQITYPANDVNQAIEDVVLDWTPVPGARTYDVQVALDSGFNNIALQLHQRDRHPALPAHHPEQRPVLVARPRRRPGWPAHAVGRVAVRLPAAVAGPAPGRLPDRASTAPGTMYTTAKPYYQWTPVQHATSYELEVSANENFSPAPPQSARRPARPTRHAERRLRLAPGGGPCTGGCADGRAVPGQRPPRHLTRCKQAFQWTQPAPPGGAWEPAAVVTGLKIAVDGSGIATGTAGHGRRGNGCADALCAGVPTTPVLSWDPVPGATSYDVYYAQDETSPPRRSRASRHDQHDVRAAVSDSTGAAREPGRLGVLLARAALPDGCTAVPTRCPATRCRTRRRSARRRRLSPACPRPTPTPARSPSAGRTTSTPTWPPLDGGQAATRRPRRTGSRWPPTRRSAHRRHADGRPDDLHGVRPAVPRRHVLLARAGDGRPGQRADWSPRRRASPRPARPSCPARRWVGPWCRAPPRCAGTPRRSPRRTRSRSTRTTTRRSAPPTGCSPPPCGPRR